MTSESNVSGGKKVIQSREPNPLHLGLAMVAMAVMWATWGVYVVHESLPFNAVNLPLADALNTRVWFPEAWGFFTRDPRESRVLVRMERRGRWVPASLGPQARLSNAFGLRRRARAQGVEIGLLLEEVPDSAWVHCTGLPEECLERTKNWYAVGDISPRPTLCGRIGFVLQPPVPWAWARSGERITMPSQVLKAEVSC
jgi:sporulation delaying protein A